MTSMLDAAIIADLMRSMPVGLFIIKSGVMTWCNGHFGDFVELTPARFIGRSHQERFRSAIAFQAFRSQGTNSSRRCRERMP